MVSDGEASQVRPAVQGTYRPQVDLLAYLRENGFKTYIVSAGGADFMRAFAEEAYGIPRGQVAAKVMIGPTMLAIAMSKQLFRWVEPQSASSVQCR